ncbi:ABHD12 [Cordylochernes scorpioides]|uniref:ABHD12 n=1 Tax=Cordylochernes scorpioides TaxID=51811 RepID=A0ABY6K6T0_9ARAC|nr:ABHD12 [Cordylochernes scorpioides]
MPQQKKGTMIRSRGPKGADATPTAMDDGIEYKEKPKETKSSPIYSRRWFKVLAVLLVVVYVVIPLLFLYYPPIRRHSVFLNYVSLSRVGNLSEPAAYGLKCAHNLYLQSEANVKLGTWNIQLPQDCQEGNRFDPAQPVVVYVHGNAGTRGGGHRVELYKLLTSDQVNLPVVAFDYRGFGDSTNVPPSARGLVRDARAVYDWVKRNGGSQVIVWGHSLGTAVSVALVAELCKEGRCPMGLVLEAPFTKVSDAARYYPLTIIHRYMPYFESVFVRSLESEETHLDSEALIADVKSPVLILHAEDDAMVPVHLGRQLFATAQRKGCQVSMVEFPQYGHKGLYKDAQLPSVVKNFVIRDEDDTDKDELWIMVDMEWEAIPQKAIRMFIESVPIHGSQSEKINIEPNTGKVLIN